MSAGAFVFFDKAILNMFSATGLIDPANVFKMTLHTSSWVPAVAADEVYADVDNELASGNGYTAGGVVLAGVALTQVAGVTKFTFSAPQWSASSGPIPAWRYGVVRASGTLNGKVGPVVGYFVGDTTSGGTDVPATPDGYTLIVTPHANGMLTAEQV
jgi:hypothetical protein